MDWGPPNLNNLLNSRENCRNTRCIRFTHSKDHNPISTLWVWMISRTATKNYTSIMHHTPPYCRIVAEPGGDRCLLLDGHFHFHFQTTTTTTVTPPIRSPIHRIRCRFLSRGLRGFPSTACGALPKCLYTLLFSFFSEESQGTILILL